MKFIFGIGVGAVLILAVLEAVFRLMPVTSGLRMANSDFNNPTARYLPEEEYVYSFGWALLNSRSGTTNDQGFANSPNFYQRPRVLVVGDSFVESLMHSYQDTVQGQLDAILGGQVLAAACSGNMLADSLDLVKYYAPRIHPSVVVIFVKNGDVSSLLDPPPKGHAGFVVSGSNVSLTHNWYKESPYREIAMRSALVRYISTNLKFAKWLSSRFGAISDQKASVADNNLNGAKENILRFYFSEVRAAGGPSKIIFLLDGNREAIYREFGDDKAHAVSKAANAEHDRRIFSDMASSNGFFMIDMEPQFLQHWLKHRERLDYLPEDGHWNQVAHRLAAMAVLSEINR